MIKKLDLARSWLESAITLLIIPLCMWAKWSLDKNQENRDLKITQSIADNYVKTNTFNDYQVAMSSRQTQLWDKLNETNKKIDDMRIDIVHLQDAMGSLERTLIAKPDHRAN